MTMTLNDSASNWLVDAQDVRAIRAHPDDVVLCDTAADAPPPPPVLPPSRSTVDHVVRQLLASGQWATAIDGASGNSYFFDAKSRATTWNLHALVERDFPLHSHLAKGHSAAAVSPSPKAADRSDKKIFSDGPKGRAGQQVPTPSPHKASGSTQPHTVTKAEWRDRIYKLYKEHNPSHVMVVDELLHRYDGNEEQLWRNLMSKYPPSVLAEQQAGKGGKPQPSAARRLFDDRDGATAAAAAAAVVAAAAATKPRFATSRPSKKEEPAKKEDAKPTKEATPKEATPKPNAPVVAIVAAAAPPSPAPKTLQVAALAPASPHPAPDPDVESPSKHANDTTAATADADEALPPTPDVSDIHSQDDVLQAARAAAERKAALILKRSKTALAAQQQRTASPKAATPSRGQPTITTSTAAAPAGGSSPSATWLSELKRREDDARSRRAALQQAKLDAQRRRQDDVARRAAELAQIRADELALQRQHKLQRTRSTTPVRGGHADPSVNALGKENLVGVTEKRLERAESSTRVRSASARRQVPFDASSPAYASNWHTSRLIAAAERVYTPERSSARKRLSAEDMKASVERLMRHRSTTPNKAAPAA